ncbi:hypothetical protein CEXT_589201 [Caerostris extrusa]|uniref:Secreted protein n=1 Tax=Caerostris extrusa TaxID=172846 RepID=A0AAV4U3X2_CAEEX|nr:hypothetical protein CEXT_589201 [Caerostris extrusa]
MSRSMQGRDPASCVNAVVAFVHLAAIREMTFFGAVHPLSRWNLCKTDHISHPCLPEHQQRAFVSLGRCLNIHYFHFFQKVTVIAQKQFFFFLQGCTEDGEC